MDNQLAKVVKSGQYILLAMSLLILMINIEYSGISILVPKMQVDLNLTLAQTQWSVSLYLLAFVSIIVSSGRFGDLFGRRSILVIGLIIFIFGSLLGGIAQHASILLLGRVLQGLGSAIMWPNATALALTSVGEGKKAFAVGILMGISGLAMSFGPPLAGFLAAVMSWRWFFLLNVPIGLAILIYILFFVAIPNKKSEGTVDYKGLIILTLAIVLLVFGINQLAIKFICFLIWFIVAIILFGLFYFTENKMVHPLIDIALFKDKNFVIGCSMRWLVNFAYYVLLFIMGLYLHVALQYTTFKAGLLFLPMTVLIGIISPFGGKLIDKVGAIKPVAIALLLFIVAYLSFIIINSHHSTTEILLLFILPGISYGIISAGLLVITMKSIPEEKTGVASGIFYMMSVLGSLIGVAITGVILEFCKQTTMQQTLLAGFPAVMIMCALVTAGAFLLLLFYVKNVK